MVKVKTICRNEKQFKKQTNTDIEKMIRNPKEELHPFQQAKEYQRALNSAKLEKVFAKPFIAALDDHSDGITVMAKQKTSLVNVISGSADGELVYWNLAEQSKKFIINAH
jgi:WD repeat and SOF domain-containing protein 1